MGLFSNNKKLCPICGSPTPRLLPTKVEDMPLCKECAGKVDLPDGVLERMSLDQFKKYITYYDENQALRDAFKETDRMSFGFLSGELLEHLNNAVPFNAFPLRDCTLPLESVAAWRAGNYLPRYALAFIERMEQLESQKCNDSATKAH